MKKVLRSVFPEKLEGIKRKTSLTYSNFTELVLAYVAENYAKLKDLHELVEQKQSEYVEKRSLSKGRNYLTWYKWYKGSYYKGQRRERLKAQARAYQRKRRYSDEEYD